MRFLAVLFVCVHSLASAACGQATIGGRVTGGQADDRICVRLLRWQTDINDQLIAPTKHDFFRAVNEPGTSLSAGEVVFQLSVDRGTYSVLAFADRNGNQRWDPSSEPMGWYASQAAGKFGRVDLEDAKQVEVTVVLQALHPFDSGSRSVPGGTLRPHKGYTVLTLSGDARARGYAHGRLLAAQILDFFRYYILEEKFGSAQLYASGFAKFLETHFHYPEPFVQECQAVLDGMRDSGQDLSVPELGRDFALVDLYAINGYIETRAMRSSCTQFAAWGARTESTDVDGGMITGRNMDGEIDLRRVTVSHFLLLAVDPAEAGQQRFVSMMWPGFVATISGFNEDGFYAMENAGLTGPGPVVNQLVPFSWTMRQSLALLGADATPERVQQLVDSFDNAAGGACGPGCITLFAMPFTGQADPAFILEGDRFGDAIRRAGDAEPRLAQFLVASNHHRRYGVDPRDPDQVFGEDPGFSSRWRYEAGQQKAAAWHRTGRGIGTLEMRELLQTVAHGTTEYSIITRPNRREFDVAVASMQAEPWDAPYRDWTRFTISELFSVE